MAVKKPMGFKEGLAQLVEECGSTPLGLVRVSSSCRGVDLAVITVRDSDVGIAAEYLYSPPEICSHRMDLHEHRAEYLEPDVVDPSLFYLIVDDSVETGYTLEAARDKLLQGGANITRIWCYSLVIKPGDTRLMLDKAETILDYVRLG